MIEDNNDDADDSSITSLLLIMKQFPVTQIQQFSYKKLVKLFFNHNKDSNNNSSSSSGGELNENNILVRYKYQAILEVLFHFNYHKQVCMYV